MSGAAQIDILGYAVTIASGLLDHVARLARIAAPAHRYALVTDSIVGPLYALRVASQFPETAVQIFTIPAGEVYKNRDSWASITDQLLASKYTRDSAIIALGGGVVGDVAGFVAATFMRGIPFVQVPTTLLAMIDASIGGKTGVDTPAGKNMVGAFHAPKAVLIDPEVLDTLEVSQWRAGLAEAVKHGVIADESYFTFLSDADRQLLHPDPDKRDRAFRDRLIARSIQIKADIVAGDEREQGVRKTLNFGHTIGHAVELLNDFTMNHGDAVAIGMVLEASAAERAGVSEPGTTARITEALARLGLPTACPPGLSADAVLDTMRGDKKSRAGSIEYAVPIRVGIMAGAAAGYSVPLDDTLVRDVIREAAHGDCE